MFVHCGLTFGAKVRSSLAHERRQSTQSGVRRAWAAGSIRWCWGCGNRSLFLSLSLWFCELTQFSHSVTTSGEQLAQVRQSRKRRVWRLPRRQDVCVQLETGRGWIHLCALSQHHPPLCAVSGSSLLRLSPKGARTADRWHVTRSLWRGAGGGRGGVNEGGERERRSSSAHTDVGGWLDVSGGWGLDAAVFSAPADVCGQWSERNESVLRRSPAGWINSRGELKSGEVCTVWTRRLTETTTLLTEWTRTRIYLQLMAGSKWNTLKCTWDKSWCLP